ncbi:actin-binding LIM protein 1-like isoform X7 [Corythoichthys intestinalis]|uniref:actin-binding LIM protein 1-like isoform X7 n=1 Tax=Corythoichthys intestinalis TaxID=161448 RepID=UPI0025A5E3F5|nr:actin-binding LIM protein 1-like isoform X7 [Corythoichthys intestinalis]
MLQPLARLDRPSPLLHEAIVQLVPFSLTQSFPLQSHRHERESGSHSPSCSQAGHQMRQMRRGLQRGGAASPVQSLPHQVLHLQGQPFPAGDCVTFSGKECICQRCVSPLTPPPTGIRYSNNCNGCGRDIKNGQALLALGSQWHLGCFKCNICKKMLSGEYISKDGVPYCEKDYQLQFGVQCDSCQKFITGKVLEAGDKHYHPECARCSRCDKMFSEGEEMYLQGSAVWHPDCRERSRNHDSNRSTLTSSESSCSRPGSCTPGSPGRSICAKVDDEIIDYRDLAAIPKVKAIYDIEHPDMMSYKSESIASAALESRGQTQERQKSAESLANVSETTEESYELRKCIPKSASHGSFGIQSYSRHSYTPTRSPQHFHRPGSLFSTNDTLLTPSSCHRLSPDTRDQGFNMYRKPPIFKQQDSNSSQTSSLPGYGCNGLSPPQSAEFLRSSGDTLRDFKVCERICQESSSRHFLVCSTQSVQKASIYLQLFICR